jgi:hypothetical protein
VNAFPTKTQNLGLFRGIVLAFAFVLGCQATWILDSEFYRPLLPGFPDNPQAAAAAAAVRNRAALAASLGVIRGDLWAEDALTYLDLFLRDDRGNARVQDTDTVDRARDVARRALSLAPHDARIWLVLAAVDSRSSSLNREASAALRMSYYTGANETELIPLRLLLAARSGALVDKDFAELVRHDIRTVDTRKPALKPAIVAAYRDAPPLGRQFIEDTLEEIDPALRARLEANE